MNEQGLPTWKDLGACKGSDSDVFFPSQWDMQLLAQAKAICATCPVQMECLEYGLHEDGGVWGGTSEKQRVRIRRDRRRAGNPIERRNIDKVIQRRKPDAIVPV